MKDEMKFNTGDVVRLKSGSPDMTVGNILSADAMRVTWFEGPDKRTAILHRAMIEKNS